MASSQEPAPAVLPDISASSPARAQLEDLASPVEKKETISAVGRKTRRRNNKSRSTSAVDDVQSVVVGSEKVVAGSADGTKASRVNASVTESDRGKAATNGKLDQNPDASTSVAAPPDSSAIAKARAAVVKAKSKAQKSAKVKKAIELANKEKGTPKGTVKRGGSAAKQVNGKSKVVGGKAVGKSAGKGARQNKKGSGTPTSTQISGSDGVSGPSTPPDQPKQADKTVAAPTEPTGTSLVTATASPRTEVPTARKLVAASESADTSPRPNQSNSKPITPKPIASNPSTRRMRPGKAARQQTKLEAASRASPAEMVAGETLPIDPTPPAQPTISSVDDSTANASASAGTSVAAVSTVKPATRAAARRGMKRGPLADETTSDRPVAISGNAKTPNRAAAKTSAVKPAHKKARTDKVTTVRGAKSRDEPTRASEPTLNVSIAPVASTDNMALDRRSELQRELEQTVLRLKVAELEIQKLKLEAELARSRNIGSVVDE